MLFWVHLAATGLFAGATAGLALFAVPAARGLGEPLACRARLTRSLRIYDPFAIGLLGVMVMTGAWSVTAYKQSLGQAYFAAYGARLAWKLVLAFLVVLFGTYLSLGLGHRLVRQEDSGEEVDQRVLTALLARLGATAWLTVAFTIATVVAAMRR